jgi:hypothetical protein
VNGQCTVQAGDLARCAGGGASFPHWQPCPVVSVQLGCWVVGAIHIGKQGECRRVRYLDAREQGERRS